MQQAFDATKPWERVTKINHGACVTYMGAGCVAAKFGEVIQGLKDSGVSAIGLVTSKGAYKKSGAFAVVEPILEELKMNFVHYDKVVTNPTTSNVDEAVKMFRESKDSPVGAILAIGGGSPLDAGKAISVMMEYPDNKAADIVRYILTPTKALPFININLTHGTGSETDRFYVNTIDDQETCVKVGTAFDLSYPMASFDDPLFTRTLGKELTAWVTVDCLNHVLEAATTDWATPLAVNLAKHVCELIAEFLPIALKDPSDIRARYYLMYASYIGGISMDSAFLHATHAMEHALSAIVTDLPHGLGLALLMPSVYKRCFEEIPVVVREILSPIVKLEENATGENVFEGMRNWLAEMGISQRMGSFFKKEDIDMLVKHVHTCGDFLCTLAPFTVDDAVMKDIFSESF
eukprot:TRINITY_DN2116_c0_g1_i1.p1 TRINITY_DN2116_c0_g1~~TRINITY_DN2116_c0_g1_i1.p1  ORF type:complete len:405 (+),score=166.43 TRINITY_DN2116_c0_g1_i1:94-1308(+)